MATMIIEVEMHTICGGQLAVNVLHFQGDTAETDKFLVAKGAVLAIDETDAGSPFTATTYMDPLSDECFLSAVVARVVGAAPGSKYPKLLDAATFVGQQSQPLFSQQVAANIKLVTASGPDYTGRVFLPGIADDQIVRNRYTSTYVTLINTWRSNFEAGIESNGDPFVPVVFKRSNNTAELVTNTALSPNPGTIRRRLSPY